MNDMESWMTIDDIRKLCAGATTDDRLIAAVRSILPLLLDVVEAAEDAVGCGDITTELRDAINALQWRDFA
jgi:hypothetical protein